MYTYDWLFCNCVRALATTACNPDDRAPSGSQHRTTVKPCVGMLGVTLSPPPCAACSRRPDLSITDCSSPEVLQASAHAATALRAGFQDILIPNTIEGDIYKRNDAPVDRKLRPPRAGPSDPRRPAAIWRGTIVGDAS